MHISHQVGGHQIGQQISLSTRVLPGRLTLMGLQTSTICRLNSLGAADSCCSCASQAVTQSQVHDMHHGWVMCTPVVVSAGHAQPQALDKGIMHPCAGIPPRNMHNSLVEKQNRNGQAGLLEIRRVAAAPCRTWMAPDWKSRPTVSRSAGGCVSCRNATPYSSAWRSARSPTLARYGASASSASCAGRQQSQRAPQCNVDGQLTKG